MTQINQTIKKTHENEVGGIHCPTSFSFLQRYYRPLFNYNSETCNTSTVIVKNSSLSFLLFYTFSIQKETQTNSDLSS